MCETRKFVIAILHPKQGLLCDREWSFDKHKQIAICLDSCQPARTVQADMARYFLQMHYRINHIFSSTKNTLAFHDKETVQLYSRIQIWTVQIRDQTARPVQSDLDLHCSLKLLVKPRFFTLHDLIHLYSKGSHDKVTDRICLCMFVVMFNFWLHDFDGFKGIHLKVNLQYLSQKLHNILLQKKNISIPNTFPFSQCFRMLSFFWSQNGFLFV